VRGSDDLGAVYDIPVQLSAVLGKATLSVSQLLRLGRGAVVELDRKLGESIDMLSQQPPHRAGRGGHSRPPPGRDDD
jgi:flagellar motor switch/type III secretory pathway protein FliN